MKKGQPCFEIQQNTPLKINDHQWYCMALSSIHGLLQCLINIHSVWAIYAERPNQYLPLEIQRMIHRLKWGTVQALMLDSFILIIPVFYSSERNSHQNNTLMHERLNSSPTAYILYCFHMTPDAGTKRFTNTIFTLRPHVSLELFTFWWWRHEWLCYAL